MGNHSKQDFVCQSENYKHCAAVIVNSGYLYTQEGDHPEPEPKRLRLLGFQKEPDPKLLLEFQWRLHSPEYDHANCYLEAKLFDDSLYVMFVPHVFAH